MKTLQNFQCAGSKFEDIRQDDCGEMECGSVSDFSDFSEPTTSSFQNSLTGGLAASSSQNSLTGSLVALVLLRTQSQVVVAVERVTLLWLRLREAMELTSLVEKLLVFLKTI